VVPVQVTDDTLGTWLPATTHISTSLRICSTSTAEVEAAASAKYDKGHEPGQAVIVTLNDL
jgi:hypothetical protein